MGRKIFDGLQKIGGTIGETLGDFAANTIDTITATAADMNKKVQEESFKSRLKKYNPLYKEIYEEKDYKYPKVIAIKSDVNRRGIDVCEGAVGWNEIVNGMEAVCLYEKIAKNSAIQFVPTTQCDSVYYVDPFNANRYINVDCIFNQTQQSKLAELSNIAYSLGAKRYSVELVDSVSSKMESSNSANINTGIMHVDVKNNSLYGKNVTNTSLANAEFVDKRNPVKPELNWFKNDENINVMINQICTDACAVKEYNIELLGSVYSTMNLSTAVNINELLVKLGVRANVNVKRKAEEEQKHKMVFHVEF